MLGIDSFKLKAEQGNRCASCAVLFPHFKLTVHHIKARRDGGSNDPRNLVALCVPCHQAEEKRVARGGSGRGRREYWAAEKAKVAALG